MEPPPAPPRPGGLFGVVPGAAMGFSGSASGLAATLGAVHALVDAASVTAVFRAIPAHRLGPETAFSVVLGYDLLAFGSQVVFGAAADRWRAARAALAAGIAATGLAVLLVPVHAVATTLLAGAGNALFHVGAGALVLEARPGRAAPSGIFVAPGALGLAVGIWIGRDGGTERIWFFLPFLAMAFMAACLVHSRQAPDMAQRRARERGAGDLLPLAVVALLLISVAVRSFVGAGAAYRCPKGPLLGLGAPLAAFGGKALGGLLADRLGWAKSAVWALLMSLPLIAFGDATTAVVLAGLFFLQMTMPVTLAAASLALPGRPGTAFGLTCLALIAGAWPTFFPEGRALYGPGVFSALIVASAMALFAGLRLLGPASSRDRPGSLPCRSAGLRPSC